MITLHNSKFVSSMFLIYFNVFLVADFKSVSFFLSSEHLDLFAVLINASLVIITPQVHMRMRNTTISFVTIKLV